MQPNKSMISLLTFRERSMKLFGLMWKLIQVLDVLGVVMILPQIAPL